MSIIRRGKNQVVELNNLTSVKVIDGEMSINITYTDCKPALDIPEGEALLIEF